VADVLERAADLIEPKGRWTQGADARNAAGWKTNGHDDAAVCFCAEGAIIHAAGKNPKHDAFQAVRRAIGAPWIHEWNDAPGRTQPEVVAKLREAAAVARERGL
jgi:hypothetical protein